MKTAILYLSKHGTTEKVARIIGDKLEEKDTELINLEKYNRLWINTIGLLLEDLSTQVL